MPAVANRSLDRPTPRTADFFKVYQLRTQGLTERQIAKQLTKSKTAVHHILQRFSAILPDSSQLDSYKQARTDLFTAAEQVTLASLMDPAKLAKASFNNLAYGLQQIHTARRLEEGKTTENVGLLARLMDDAHKSLFERQAKAEPQVETCGQEPIMRINKPKTRKRRASPVVSHSQNGSES